MFPPRAHLREPVSIEARLILPATIFTIIPCLMLDLSEGGAKVEIKVPYILPPKLFLCWGGDEYLYECEPRWQEEDMAGLMFIDICTRSARRSVLAKCANATVLEPPPAKTKAAKVPA